MVYFVHKIKGGKHVKSFRVLGVLYIWHSFDSKWQIL